MPATRTSPIAYQVEKVPAHLRTLYRLNPLVVGMRRANLGVKGTRRFEVVVVAFDPGVLQTIRHTLVFDDAE